MNKKYIDMLEKIGTMTYNLNIAYSTVTHKFYLNTDLDKIEGNNIISIGEHKDTPEKAIESAFNTLVSASEGICWTNKRTGIEKIYKWSNNSFQLISERKISKKMEKLSELGKSFCKLKGHRANKKGLFFSIEQSVLDDKLMQIFEEKNISPLAGDKYLIEHITIEELESLL